MLCCLLNGFGMGPKRMNDRKRKRTPSPQIYNSAPGEPSTSTQPGCTDQLTQFMKELIQTLQPRESTGFKGNAVPAFDPENESQDIVSWCRTIDELRDIFKWSEETTIYYAIAKLAGLAQTWYRSLPTVKLSWDEWKMKLERAFPPKRDFWDKLEQMSRRKKMPNETYTRYYYEKLSLLNSCKITGADAVSCIIGGIQEIHVKTAARAGNYADPEGLFTYLSTVRDVAARSGPSWGNKRPAEHRPQNKIREVIRCFKCGHQGHKANRCRMVPEKMCNFCNKKGHVEETCFKKKNSNQRSQPTSL